MSELSEEDITDIAEKIANFGWSDYDDFVKNKKAIQGLLDLYNKEKKKNAKLKKDKQILYGVIDEIKEERDKIKDIIKKSSYPDFAIQKINELLGE